MRYSLRRSTRIKTLVSMLDIMEDQANALYNIVGDIPIRPSPNRVSHDFEICWHGIWVKAEIKVYAVLMQAGDDGPDMLNMGRLLNRPFN